jgi:hypothetical protein
VFCPLSGTISFVKAESAGVFLHTPLPPSFRGHLLHNSRRWWTLSLSLPSSDSRHNAVFIQRCRWAALWGLLLLLQYCVILRTWKRWIIRGGVIYLLSRQRQKKARPTFRVSESWPLFANFRSTLTLEKWKNPTLTLKVEWGEKFSNFNFSNFVFWTEPNSNFS